MGPLTPLYPRECRRFHDALKRIMKDHRTILDLKCSHGGGLHTFYVLSIGVKNTYNTDQEDTGAVITAVYYTADYFVLSHNPPGQRRARGFNVSSMQIGINQSFPLTESDNRP